MPEEWREAAAFELLGYEHPSTLPEATTIEKLVLKSGDLFAVTNRAGDIAPEGARDQGFFCRDTRFLSAFKLSVSGGPALILSSQVSSEYVTQVDMTVTSQKFGGVFTGDPTNFVHLRRTQLIDGALLDRLVLTNYLTRPLDFWIRFDFAADFADVFEVRGTRRERRGTYFAPRAEGSCVTCCYRGLDRREYRTELRFSRPPTQLTPSSARFDLHLSPNATAELELAVVASICNVREAADSTEPFARRADALRERSHAFSREAAEVESSDEIFNEALAQAVADLHALTVPEKGLAVIAAGIPWYAVPFGRDSLITSYQALPICPFLARDSLSFLAAWQGTKEDDFTEEEPGKIPHEVRYGEMAATSEIPHRPYYGSVDATPLFLIVLHEYLQWTDDRESVQKLLPAAEAALGWMERFGDRDGDAFLEYERRSPRGLRNQGWKDSSDGICTPDGKPLEPPVAVVEAQGYAYDAYRRMALLYRQLGIRGKAAPLLERAQRVARAINETFWMPGSAYYGLALDKDKRLSETRSSNPGHLLWSGAVSHARARAMVGTLMGAPMYSGWGIRTVAEGQEAYNPLSYHNGSVWPHDNSIIAMGLAMYGFADEAERVLDGLYHASQYFRHRRLPELFCGMTRKANEFPVHYPVACSPQAWASAAFLLLLRATLGLFPDAPRRRLTIRNPRLPAWVTDLTLRRLRIGSSRLDLQFTRRGESVFAAVLTHSGPPLKVRIELGRRS